MPRPRILCPPRSGIRPSFRRRRGPGHRRRARTADLAASAAQPNSGCGVGPGQRWPAVAAQDLVHRGRGQTLSAQVERDQGRSPPAGDPQAHDSAAPPGSGCAVGWTRAARTGRPCPLRPVPGTGQPTAARWSPTRRTVPQPGPGSSSGRPRSARRRRRPVCDGGDIAWVMKTSEAGVNAWQLHPFSQRRPS